jgi:hypothetical protein
MIGNILTKMVLGALVWMLLFGLYFLVVDYPRISFWVGIAIVVYVVGHFVNKWLDDKTSDTR